MLLTLHPFGADKCSVRQDLFSTPVSIFLSSTSTVRGQKQNERMTFFGKVADVFLQEKLHVPKQRGHLLCSHFGPTAKTQISPPYALGGKLLLQVKEFKYLGGFFCPRLKGK